MPTLYPLPEVISPEDNICIKMQIPNEINHIGAFLGAIYNLTRWYSWARDEAKTGKEVALVWSEIYDQLIANIGQFQCEQEGFPMLRQNPSNSCQMQYMDEFGNWITFFDFGLCQAITGDDSLINYTTTNEYLNTANNELNIYLADPENYPSQDEINALGVANRNKLLCYALRVIITTYLETIATDTDRAEKGTVLLSVITGAVIALGFTPFSPVVTGLMLAGFGVGGIIGVNSVGGEEYRDIAGQDKVLCYMYNQLAGDNLTLSNFANSLNGNTFAGGTPEKAQADALAQIISRPQVYLSVIQHMKDNLSKIDALVNECEGCGGWEITFDFKLSAHGFATRTANNSLWVSGVGWQGGQPLGTYRTNGIFRNLNLGSSVLTYIRIEYYATNPRTTLVWQMSVPNQVWNLPNGTGEMTYSVTTNRTGIVRLDALQHFALSLPANSHVIRKIVIAGTGTTPSL